MSGGPDETLDLVTGATGMLGSHIAERLVARGGRVRALVRPTSDTRFLKNLGVELVTGDLSDPGSCARAVEGVRVVYHTAAKVGDWGRWSEFLSSCIEASRVLGEAAAAAKVDRFLHISSTSAYGHPDEGGPPIDETAPMGQNLWVWDGYTRSKVESEQALWKIVGERGLRLTVIRPSWLYGERDRITTARLMDRLRRGKVPLIGRGDNPLSAVYVGIVADAAILAAHHPDSVGEAYNITSQGSITQRDFLALFAAACGARPPRRRVPYALAYYVGLLCEAHGRLTGRVKPPLATRYAVWLMGRDLAYSTEKARTRLGWTPGLTYEESVARTVAWFLEQERGRGGEGVSAS